MNPLIALAIQETPTVIAALRDLFARQNPDAPVPTSEQVAAAFAAAVAVTLAKDDSWLNSHPAV